MRISIIIPTYNEAPLIEPLLEQLIKYSDERVVDIIVADGGSDDNTRELAIAKGAKVLVCPTGRACQMNKAIEHAQGDVYYFVHADCQPPNTFIKDITDAISEGYEIGCYRFQFEKQDLRLRINAYFTRYNLLMMRGGDQTLFVTQSLFKKLQGYDSNYVIMEDFDLIRRARKICKFKIFEKSVLISARKYEHNGYFKVQFANLYAFLQFYFGAKPEKIKQAYHRHLKLN